MYQIARHMLLTGFLPAVLALAIAGLTVLEQATVDPSISADWLGASRVPVWYVPLAAFATLHSLLHIGTAGSRTRSTLFVGILLVAIAAGFHAVAGPILLAEVVYGIIQIALYLTIIGIFLWPLLVGLTIATAGGLFGLSIFLPLMFARRLDGGGPAPVQRRSSRPLIGAGIAVAVTCVLAFGNPTAEAQLARGRYSFPGQSASIAWYAFAPTVAACCAILTLATALTFGSVTTRRLITTWLLTCALPLLALTTATGPVLRQIEAGYASSRFARAAVLAPFPRFVRDGRARTAAPISIAGMTILVERSLLGYQLADNRERQVTTVVLRPTPELAALDVRDRVVLNAWPAQPERQYAESRGATCTPDAVRPVFACRFPGQSTAAVEVDATAPTRVLKRGTDCHLLLDALGGRRLHALIPVDCTASGAWTERAAAIERALIAMLGPPP